MPNSTSVKPRVHGAPRKLRPEDTPGPGGNAPTPPLGPVDASSGPRHACVRWVNACEALDHKQAVRLRRELLKRFGILISLAPRRGGHP